MAPQPRIDERVCIEFIPPDIGAHRRLCKSKLTSDDLGGTPLSLERPTHHDRRSGSSAGQFPTSSGRLLVA